MRNSLLCFMVLFGLSLGGLKAEEGGPCMSTLKPPKGKYNARLVELKGVKWKTGQTVRILFMDGTAEERKLVRDTASEWTQYANLKFEFYDSKAALRGQKSDIRITFDKKQGSHSSLGTHAQYYGQDESTMNYGWNSRSTILHEFGHALGLQHEHQNPAAGIPWNKEFVYAYFAKQGWTNKQVDSNVFEQFSADTVNFTSYDKDSIMVYEFPATWTTNGMSAKRSGNLSAVDKDGIAKMYPGGQTATTPVAVEPVATPTAPPVTSIATTESSSLTVGAQVQCGKLNGTILQILNKKSLMIKLGNGKKAVVAISSCGFTQTPTEGPATSNSANISEGDTVQCGNLRGKVVRTIGDNLLIDFDGGKRDYAKRNECRAL